MRTLFVIAAMYVSCLAMAQQSVTIKTGTIIPLKSVNLVRAADVHEGELVPFTTPEDVVIEGKKIIERGTIIHGKVREACRSTVAGTKGRLVIDITQMTLSDGTPMYFADSTVRIYGKNKTPVAVATAIFFWPCILICGTRAEMPAGYETRAIVANNTEIKI